MTCGVLDPDQGTVLYPLLKVDTYRALIVCIPRLLPLVVVYISHNQILGQTEKNRLFCGANTHHVDLQTRSVLPEGKPDTRRTILFLALSTTLRGRTRKMAVGCDDYNEKEDRSDVRLSRT